MIEHLAIIMDGNGRWAKNKGLDRIEGHKKGEEIFETVCKLVSQRGIKFLTVYAFSTENWNREPSEVRAILKIIEEFFASCSNFAQKNNFKISVIGDKSRLEQSFEKAISNAECLTKDNSGLHIHIAINYGGQNEIVRAVNKCLSSRSDVCELSEQDIHERLDNPSLPYPDLLIRTGGEKRLSNFMLWELAYTELYFTDVLWPDFNENALNQALNEYELRERRYGNVQ